MIRKCFKISISIIGYFQLIEACTSVPFHPFLQKQTTQNLHIYTSKAAGLGSHYNAI